MAANRAASIPPMEWPTMAARLMPSDASSLRMFAAMSLKLYGMIGFDDRPKPI